MAETTTVVEVREITSADQDHVRRSLTAAFGATEVAGHDELIDAAALPGAVARVGDDPVGLLTYRPDADGGWEVVSLAADRPGVGAGRALIDWVRAAAARAGATRLWHPAPARARAGDPPGRWARGLRAGPSAGSCTGQALSTGRGLRRKPARPAK